MRKAYPVIFTRDGNEYLIEVPDLEIMTQGNDLEDAISMARDAIGAKGIYTEDKGKVLPKPTALEEIKPEKGEFANIGKTFVSLVDVDFTAYRRKADKKTVRRTITLPNWINKEAEDAGVNVSAILREALIEKLELEKK